jgi:glutamine amidotransferase
VELSYRQKHLFLIQPNLVGLEQDKQAFLRGTGMCRLLGLLSTSPSNLSWPLVRAPNSLAAQSRKDGDGKSHLDGWGIGYHVGRYPVVIWSTASACQDSRYALITRSICARALLAHVRDASVGGKAVANTHPFTYGPWLFAHNGTLSPFDRVAPSLLAEINFVGAAMRRGHTDSELIFFWLLAQMDRAGLSSSEPCDSLQILARTFGTAVRELAARCQNAGETAEPAKLNFLLSDGSVMLASRWGHSLFFRSSASSDTQGNGKAYPAVLIASEPTDDGPWQEVPDRSLLTVGAQRGVSCEPL